MKGHYISENPQENCYSAFYLCLNFLPREITSEENREAELEQIITHPKSQFRDNVLYLNFFIFFLFFFKGARGSNLSVSVWRKIKSSIYPIYFNSKQRLNTVINLSFLLFLNKESPWDLPSPYIQILKMRIKT